MDGGQRRDFVDVRDVASANLAASSWTGAVADETVRAFNIGSGVAYTGIAAPLTLGTSTPNVTAMPHSCCGVRNSTSTGLLSSNTNAW